MSRIQPGCSSNPLITRVNQHRALAVLFRAPQDERAAQAAPVQRSTWILGRLLDQPMAQASSPTVEANESWFDPTVAETMNEPTPAPARERVFAPSSLSARVPVQPVQRQLAKAIDPTKSALTIALPEPANLPTVAYLPLINTQTASKQVVVARQPAVTAQLAEPRMVSAPVVPELAAEIKPMQPETVGQMNQPTQPVQLTGIDAPRPQAAMLPVTQSAPRTQPQTQGTEGIDDATWARLQTIYRKHQAQSASESAAPRQEVTQNPPIAQRQSETSDHREVMTEKSPNLSAVQRMIPPTPVVKTGPTQPDPTRQTVATEPKSIAPTTLESLNEWVAPALMDDPRQNLEGNEEAASAWVQATEVDEETGAPATSPSEPQRQALPLQAVWPVQRVIAPAMPMETPLGEAILSDTDNDHATVTREPASSYLSEQARQKLDTIQTGRPTDSKIDVVAPRRPRPVQPKSIEASRVVSAPNAPSGQQATPNVQHSVEPSMRNEQTYNIAQSTLIETEIGALPSDLWPLIGEKPPLPTQHPGVSPAPSSRTAPVIEHAVARGGQNQKQNAEHTGVEPHSNVIVQRQTMSLAVPTREPATEAIAAPDLANATIASSSPLAGSEPEPGVDKQLASIVGQTASLSMPLMQYDNSTMIQRSALSPLNKQTGEVGDVVDDELGQTPLSPPELKNVARLESTPQFEVAGSVVRRANNTTLVATSQPQPSAASQESSSTEPIRKAMNKPMKNSANGATVQRQVDDASEAVQALLPSSKKKEEDHEQAKPAEVNLDELAQQVYAQLRRRLAIDRERLRRTNG